MENLRADLSENGFDVPNIQLDKKMIRFNRGGKNNAWFVGFENKTKKGETYVVAVYGDWRTGEKYEYRTERKYTKAQESEILRNLRDSQADLERERQVLRKNAKSEAASQWNDGGSPTNCEYLSTKKIPGLFGCRTQLGMDGRFLLVPMRDVHGELWGLQKIYPSGEKYFLTGQRIDGLFHTVSGLDECDLALEKTIYITEGFATAVSIHQSIGKPLVVAFNAQNLPKVAKELKDKYPQAQFVICADDDQFTTRKDRDGNDVSYNPGREYGQKAADVCTGSVVYPEFESLGPKPTDFNDLHLMEGLEKVKAQILGTPMVEAQYMLCLGHIGDKFYYTSSDQPSVIELSAGSHKKERLMAFLPLSYWMSRYPGEKDFSICWDDAASDLMDKCRKKGIYKKHLSRGCGAWREDDGELVINLGDEIWTKGGSMGLKSLKSRYIYEASSNSYLKPSSQVLSLGECQELVEILGSLSWENPNNYIFLAGWLAIAPICGAIPWRPHVWITGSKGTGKSTVMDEIVGPLVRDYSKRFEGSTTEAGIRQTLKTSAMPVLFDEFETERGSTRIDNIIKVFRSASSEKSGPIIKGSSGGEAQEYSTRFSAVVSSINVNLQQQQDESRFTIAALKKGGVSYDAFRALSARITDLLTDDFCQRFFNRSVQRHGHFMENFKLLSGIISELHDARTGQQYGSLLAGFGLLETDSVLTMEHARHLVDMAQISERREDMTEDVEIDCFNHMLTSMVRVNGEINPAQELTVGEAIKNCYPSNMQDSRYIFWRRSLHMHGIRVEDDSVYVANRHPQVRKIFNDTVWQENIWAQHLIKVDGAEKSKTVRFGGKLLSRCVKIPKNQIL